MNSGPAEQSLAPISVELEKQIALDVLYFFDPPNAQQLRSRFGLPGQATPDCFSVGEFFDWRRRIQPTTVSYDSLYQHVIQIIRRLEHVGLLSLAGRNRSGALEESNLYVSTTALSTGAARGALFLGKALGAAFIANELPKALVAITGMSGSGNPAIGSGLHIHSRFLLTCKHVIDDLKSFDVLRVNGTEVTVVDGLMDADDKIDVGVIEFQPEVPLALPDLQFRDAALLEEIVVAGFPTVPTSLGGFPTFQRGEISQVGVKTVWGNAVDLFSAIARPGNSGGPLVTPTGNVVGLVTQSLERETEEGDRIRVLPFFAAVPASDVRSVYERLTGYELPWETYQRERT
jgi:S1-C subfamily serine protease